MHELSIFIIIFLLSLLILSIPAIPAAVVIGMFYAYKKLPLHYFLLLLVALVAVPCAVFKSYERNFMLSVIPDALHVNSVSYSKEESWGFGPGGNEAGIRVYPLPQHIADKISQQGIEFFNTLPPNQNQKSRGWRGKYSKWSQTPIKADGKMDIYDYICRYGFCIEIDGSVVEQATEIVNSEGNYYAYGRVGLIVVSPSKKLVLYMYNG
ncbi:MAG: hypothetical protein LBP54_04420 [Campylobacteraceae bacterium]|jgi:hypothetical protein|nr:hypothetical protein [Campylobacteraceae bacterium]